MSPSRPEDTTVVELRVHTATVPLTTPFVTSVRRAEAARIVIVEARDAAGRIGRGEAATSWRVTGESPESVAAVVAGPLAEAVVGRRPDDPALVTEIARAVWGNAAARSAVECALAELASAQSGEPLWRRLGAAASVVRTDRTVSAGAPAEVARAAAQHLAEGFEVIKVKVRAGDDALAVLRAVRAAVGDAAVLRLDANQAWSIDEAVRTIHDIEDEGIPLEFAEQPVAAADLVGLATLSASVATPIMADESVRTAADVAAVAEHSAASLVNIKLAKTGGLAEALRAAEVARENGLGVVVGCMLEGAVGIGAAAAFAAAVAPDVVHDLDGAHWLADAVAAEAPTRFDGDRILLDVSGGRR